MKANIIISCSCLLFVTSCGQKSYDTEDFDSIPLTEIGGTQMSSDIIAPSFQSISQIGDRLMLDYTSFSDDVYVFINPQTGKIEKRMGKFGDGPEDFISQELTGISEHGDTIYAFDITRMQSADYIWNDTLHDYIFKKGNACSFKEPSFLIGMKRMKNGCYVGQLLGGKDSMFVLFDKNLNEITRFGKIPFEGLTANQVDFIPFRGYIATYGNSIYFCMHNFAYVARYDVEESRGVNLIWEHFLVEPKFEVENGEKLKILGHENTDGFFNLTANEKYIFLLYSGEYTLKYRDTGNESANVPNTLLVLNPEGKIVSKCHFKDRGTKIGLSSDNEKVYIETENPEPNIMVYKMSDILSKAR